jgi:hypothetical protein
LDIDHGVFFVNQRHVPAYPEGTTTVDQMYVQYDIPAGRKDLGLPVVVVPGGFHTSATYDSTPDGRPGWRDHFVRAGHPVYLPEHVGHGPSGFAHRLIDLARRENDGSRLPPILFFTHEQVWPIFRFGPEHPSFHADTQFPVDAIDEYWAQLVPNTEVFQEDPAGVTVQALGKLLERIGPSVLIVHSQSGRFAPAVAGQWPDLAAGVIALEPAAGAIPGAPSPEIDERIGLDKSVDYSSWLPQLTQVPFLFVWGDHLHGDFFWDIQHDWASRFIDDVVADGGRADHLDLPERGLAGNTHMLMLERNNLEVADHLLIWITRL